MVSVILFLPVDSPKLAACGWGFVDSGTLVFLLHSIEAILPEDVEEEEWDFRRELDQDENIQFC